MNMNGPGPRPILSPDVGDVVFNINVGASQRIFRRLRVTKVTATQIQTISVRGVRTRYWRKNGYEVGGYHTNCLALVEPEAPAFEAKHEVGKPLPEPAA